MRIRDCSKSSSIELDFVFLAMSHIFCFSFFCFKNALQNAGEACNSSSLISEIISVLLWLCGLCIHMYGSCYTICYRWPNMKKLSTLKRIGYINELFKIHLYILQEPLNWYDCRLNDLLSQQYSFANNLYVGCGSLSCYKLNNQICK